MAGFANVAGWDRALRVALGIGMIYAGFTWGDGLLAATLRVFGLLPLITGLIGWSPLYSILGFRTNKKKT